MNSYPIRRGSESLPRFTEHILNVFISVCTSHVKKKKKITTERGLLSPSRHAHAPHPSRDDCFDLCSEEIRPSVLDVTGWHITWIQANKRAEGKNIKGTFQAFTESFQNGTMTLPLGEKVIMLVCLY